MNNFEHGKRSVLLQTRGSHVPSFKNSKLLTKGRLITNPRNQKWMEECIQVFSSQLICSCPMSENETVTAQKLRSWIASSTPENDSCRYLIACSWRFTKVSKGQEGVNVRIEQLKS